MNKNTNRRSLLTSIISLVMCVAMLAGTTFAWFTDTASTSVNQIQAGNLNVEMEYLGRNEDGNEVWLDAEDADSLFDKNALWEPGFTQVVYLKIRNAGNLAMKYAMNVTPVNEFPSTNVYGEVLKLSDYLKFGWAPMTLSAEGTVTKYDTAAQAREASASHMAPLGNELKYYGENTLEPGAETAVALVVWMPESVGNEANHASDAEAPRIELGIKLKATQAASEYDSFSDQYDADAEVSLDDDHFAYFDYEVATEEVADYMGMRVKWGRNAAGAIVAVEILDTAGVGGRIPDSAFTTQRLNAEGKYEFDPNTQFANLKKVTFAEDAGVTEIGDRAFDRCLQLSEITIPEGVTSIGTWAFCRNRMTDITIPSSVTEIGEDAFLYCLELKSATINSSVIGTKAFEKNALETVQLNGVTEIGNLAFNGCTALKSIEIPDTVSVIRREAFLSCSGLTSLTVVDGTALEENAFKNCTGLKSVELNNATVGKNAFNNCTKLSNLTINGGTIGEAAFNACSSLKKVTVNNTESVGADAFLNCKALEEVTVNSGTIGNTAFKFCDALKTVNLDGVTSLGNGVFTRCTSLEQITIPASVTSIGGDVFMNCSALKTVNFNASISAINGAVFKGCAPESLMISDLTTEIKANALNNVSNLTSLTVKSGTWKKANNASITKDTSDPAAFLQFYKDNYRTGIVWVSD